MATKFVTPRLATSTEYVSPHFDGELMDGMSLDNDFLNVAGCGTRPICAFTKACKERQANWQSCVDRNSLIKKEGKFGSSAPVEAPYVPQTSSSSPSSAPTKSGLSTGALVAIIGSVAVIGVGAYFLLRK